MKSIIRAALPAGLLLASAVAQSHCESTLPLAGTVSIPTCSRSSAGCEDAGQALFHYMELSDDNPARLTVGLQSSPWRLYDPNSRIIPIEEFAAMIRPHLTGPVKTVELQASWTSVSPSKSGTSLARQLSLALKGFPVTGMDGFLWVASNGAVRTTHQAFSVRKGGGPYGVHKGDEVMAALVEGWKSEVQAEFEKQRDANGLLHAAVGWDVFYLCPDRALATFELSAQLGSAIGAYNAAVMRIERGRPGDREAAIALLEKAAAMQDAKSAALLHQLGAPASRAR